jgi:hypothetical protein
VLIQVIKDAGWGSVNQRNDVIRWLAKIDDVRAIVEPLGLNAEDTRMQIAHLFRVSPALSVHYAQQLIARLKKNIG